MKKRVSFIVSAIMALSIFASCADADVKKLTLSSTSFQLALYQTFELTAHSEDADVSVQWSVSDNTVLEITADGMSVEVRAIAAGQANVVVSAGKVQASCQVTVVTDGEVPALTVTPGTAEVAEGKTLQLTPTLKYKGEQITGELSFRTENADIAQVSSTGLVTGKEVGETRIEVSVQYYSFSYSVFVDVEVKPGVVIAPSAAQILLYEQNGTEGYEHDLQLSAQVFAYGEQLDLPLTFVVDDTDVAQYDDGTISAVAKGSTHVKISCTYEQKQYYINVPVIVKNIPIVAISLSQESAQVYSAAVSSDYPNIAIFAAEVVVDDEEMADAEITWSSSNQAVATVNNGRVTGVGAGSAVITAEFEMDGKTYTSTADIVVVAPIDFGASNIVTGKEGAIIQLKPAHLITIQQEIDVQDKTKDDALLALHIMPSTVGSTDFFEVFLYLTDSQSPSQGIIIGIFYNPTDKVSYARAGIGVFGQSPLFKGRDSLNPDNVFNSADHGSYGTALWHLAANGMPLFDGASPKDVGIAYDSAENALYLHHYNYAGTEQVRYLLVDFDVDFPDSGFTGFSSGKINIMLHGAQFLNLEDGMLMISQIDGRAATEDDVTLSAW